MKKSYFLTVFILILIYLIFTTIKPLISSILSSFILAFVFYPLYLKINNKIKNSNVSSAITLIIILLLIILPSLLIINLLAQESLSVYQKVRYEDLSSLVSKYLESDFDDQISGVINNALLLIVKSTSSFILSLPGLALNFFITLFLTYYLLKEAQIWIQNIKNYLPYSEKMKDAILEKMKRVTKALIYGTILTAIIQGFLGGIGFAIFNIPSPVLWGFVMAFTSVIPILGTAIVWLPAGIIQLFQGDYFSGFGIILFGALIVGTIDNVIKPKLIGKRADIHPAIVLIGIIGGLNFLGFIGLIIGPLILAVAFELVKIRKHT
ncbi:AI-2E family transporter [Candidatus Woesearchaeota archaeon]|nr:AI-2E family transporter [Candidatus Woesearchaeota archaeon]